jgi:hypothetical protein
MASAKETTLIVEPPSMSSWRSSTGPCCSTCAALRIETLGIWMSFRRLSL